MRNKIFWGSVLILLGLIMLFGYQFDFPIWNLLWPFMLIVVGCWIMLIPFLSRGIQIIEEDYSFPSAGVEQATLKIEHGAGTINLKAEDLPENLFTGKFIGGVNAKVHSSSEGKYRIKLQSKVDFFNFLPRFQKEQRLAWDLAIKRDVPFKFKMETGASSNYLDFRGSQLKNLHLATGASSTELYLPENAGFTKVVIESGASSVQVHVPAEVAAKIKISGLVGKMLDIKRFPQMGEYYQSPDYESSQNRVQIIIESGVGSIDID